MVLVVYVALVCCLLVVCALNYYLFMVMFVFVGLVCDCFVCGVVGLLGRCVWVKVRVVFVLVVCVGYLLLFVSFVFDYVIRIDCFFVCVSLGWLCLGVIVFLMFGGGFLNSVVKCCLCVYICYRCF